MIRQNLWADVSTIASKEKALDTDISVHIDKGEDFLDTLQHIFMTHVWDIALGFIVLIIGYYLARFSKKIIYRLFASPRYDLTVKTFVGELVYYGIWFLAVISALSAWGVPYSTFVAVVGGLGLAVGLALQSNMSNLASGLLILVFKPFKVGDWVHLTTNSTVVGKVERIELLYTAILSKEKKTLFVPNSQMTSNPIMNNSYAETRCIRFDIGISYESDHHKAIAILKDIFTSHELVLNKDAIEIGIASFGDSSVNIVAYPEVHTGHTLEFFYWAMSEIKDRFDSEGVNLPYPQRDVHLYHMNSLQVEGVQTRSGIVSVQGKVVDHAISSDDVPAPKV